MMCRRKRAVQHHVLVVAVGVCLAISNGCTLHQEMPYQTVAEAQKPTTSSSGPDERFVYPPHEIPFENHVMGAGANEHYTYRQMTFPSIGDNGQTGDVFHARYFQSNTHGVHPLVIVLPIWTGPTYPSRKITSFLQNQSEGAVHVLDVLGEETPIDIMALAAAPDGETFLEMCRLAVERELVTIMDILRLVDWAEQRPEIDGSRVALVGFSQGAVVGGVVATQEPRLSASVFVMGGAGPHQVIARCEGKKTTAIQERASTFGWDRDELEQRLKPIFKPIDPASYPNKVDPSTVLYVDAGKDGCIPKTARDDFWEAMGRPERYTLPYGHRTSFLSMTFLGGNWLRHETWAFIQERLFPDGEEDPAL